jgi:hypothetical protein
MNVVHHIRQIVLKSEVVDVGAICKPDRLARVEFSERLEVHFLA